MPFIFRKPEKWFGLMLIGIYQKNKEKIKLFQKRESIDRVLSSRVYWFCKSTNGEGIWVFNLDLS
ncbi:MAG: hypothetical protein A2Z51_05040 [Deltaproteobacteria bacterium RBG_19FT_COMBO_52_11]|nr:MAG: hypothetical protein A2Z51_05040 [Deltaproteobacteria bacterium RBG_19FT_COMBO_52_11]